MYATHAIKWFPIDTGVTWHAFIIYTVSVFRQLGSRTHHDDNRQYLKPENHAFSSRTLCHVFTCEKMCQGRIKSCICTSIQYDLWPYAQDSVNLDHAKLHIINHRIYLLFLRYLFSQLYMNWTPPRSCIYCAANSGYLRNLNTSTACLLATVDVFNEMAVILIPGDLSWSACAPYSHTQKTGNSNTPLQK